MNRRAIKVQKEYLKATKAKDLNNRKPQYKMLRTTRLARPNPVFCRLGPWRASTRARFFGSSSAASESCLQNLMAFVRSSRAIVQYCI